MADQSRRQDVEVSPVTLKRLMKEYQNEQKIYQDQQSLSSTSNHKKPNQVASRDENVLFLTPKDVEGRQLLQWQATIRGPKGGSYEGEFHILPLNVKTYQ